MSKNLVPLGDNLIIFPYKVKESNGIILTPKTVNNEVNSLCMVCAVGKDVKNPDLKEGVMVIIPRATGKWVYFENKKYIRIHEDEILAILEGVEVRADEDKDK